MIIPKKLLALGKSFKTVRETPPRFKLVGQAYLPRLGPGQNHETAPPAPAHESSPCPTPSTPAGVLPAVPPQPEVMRLRPDAGTAASTIGGARALEDSSWFGPAADHPVSGWSRVLTRLNFLRRAAARQQRAAVQAELALSHVRVVRNDLAEADLEVRERGTATRVTGPVELPAGTLTARPRRSVATRVLR